MKRSPTGTWRWKSCRIRRRRSLMRIWRAGPSCTRVFSLAYGSVSGVNPLFNRRSDGSGKNARGRIGSAGEPCCSTQVLSRHSRSGLATRQPWPQLRLALAWSSVANRFFARHWRGASPGWSTLGPDARGIIGVPHTSPAGSTCLISNDWHAGSEKASIVIYNDVTKLDADCAFLACVWWCFARPRMFVVQSTSISRTTAPTRDSERRWYFASAADNRCSWTGCALLGGSYFRRPCITIASVTSTPRVVLTWPTKLGPFGIKRFLGILISEGRRMPIGGTVSDEQIAFALRQAESGSNVEELCRCVRGHF